MISLLVFILAAGLFVLLAKLTDAAKARPGGPRPLGFAFAVTVLLAASVGWSIHSLQHLGDPTNAAGASVVVQSQTMPDGTQALPDIINVPTRRGIPADGLLFLITAALYGLTAVRGKKQQPAWIADLLLILASLAALAVFATVRRAYGENVMSGPVFGLEISELALSVFWMWAIARLTASLNRVPQVTGGYLGVVALLVLFVLHNAGTSISVFPFVAGAALAGAGLATVPVALKKKSFNLGWSAALAMGFLMAQCVTFGLPHLTVQTTLALAFLILALPLIDMMFYRVKPRADGNSMRLHEGLMRRGFSPTKVALLYTAIACWFGVLGYLSWRLAQGGGILQIILQVLAILFIGAGGYLLFFSVARVLMRRAEGEEIPPEIEAFGVKISAVTMDEALAKLNDFIQSRRPHHVVTCDANAILRAREDAEYAGIVRRAALATPDGYGVIWGARLLGYPIYERVTGVDMVVGICELAAKNNYSIYILGSEPGENGEPGVAQIAANNLLQKYPGMRVAGTHHGFWRRDAKAEGLSAEEADARMAEQIRGAAPDVLFVALGIPMQEKFIAAQLERLQVPVSLGVGGSFDVYSGKFNRAPQWVQRIGFEWLYRVVIDPSRWKRMGYVPRFMLLAIKQWVFGSKPQQAS